MSLTPNRLPAHRKHALPLCALATFFMFYPNVKHFCFLLFFIHVTDLLNIFIHEWGKEQTCVRG